MNYSELTKTLNDAASQSGSTPGEDERAALLAACENLKKTLESPLEATLRLMFGAHQATILRTAIYLKLFDAAAQAGKGEIKTQQLASSLGADRDLLIRVMRVLTGMGLFNEIAQDTFTATPLASAYVTGSPLTEAVVHLGAHHHVVSKIPEYLEQHGFQNPGDAYEGPFQYANQTKLHYFKWLSAHPRDQSAFNTLMGTSRMGRGEDWFEFFPVPEKLRVTRNEPLLVDIGSGLGHDLVALKSKFPGLAGTLIAQDLPQVIESVKDLPPGIEAMGYDFFTPQPVKGAKAYYLRTVLHDWPDKQAREILSQIREAMNQDSILLINENVLPAEKVPLYPAVTDIHMMAMFSSLDRTEKQFKELLDAAGFEVVKVWAPKVMVPGSGTLFEATLKP